MILRVIQNGYALKLLDQTLYQDEEIVFNAIKKHKYAFKYIKNSELGHNINFLYKLYKHNINIYSDINKELKIKYGKKYNIFYENIKKEINNQKK